MVGIAGIYYGNLRSITALAKIVCHDKGVHGCEDSLFRNTGLIKLANNPVLYTLVKFKKLVLNLI